MAIPLRILIVEDSEDDAQLLVRELRRGGVEMSCQRVDTPELMYSALEAQEWDLVLSDYSMPGFSGEEALQILRNKSPDIPFIYVSGTLGEDPAVAALRSGAQDYLIKGKLGRLVPAIQREIHEAEGRRERRRLEQHIQQLQKFEAIGRLAGGVAHDFNNLLAVILGCSDVMLDELGADHPAAKRAEMIRKAGASAADLTRQLLAFSRQQMLQPQVLDLKEIVERAKVLLSRLIGENIEFNVSLEASLWRVKADPGQIEQVLVNLAVNARDAMPQGGRLTIEGRNVELDDSYLEDHQPVIAGPYVMLVVEDTGCGMDRETQSRIFDPFFTTKELGKGTGLGLATVYGIVKQSGGYIWVYSEPGHGSAFKVYLPRVEKVAQPVKRDEQEEGSFRGSETILLVEDSASLREMAREYLKSVGYTVLEGASGPEALDRAKSFAGAIHLLLTDVVMPEMSGPDLAGQIATLRPGIKIIFTSGYTDDAIARQGVLDPAAAFIPKPYRPKALARKIREVLDGHEEKSESDLPSYSHTPSVG